MAASFNNIEKIKSHFIKMGHTYFLISEDKKTIFAIKMGKATPTSGDITYSGQVFISDFGVTADDKDDVKFTATFVVSVPPLTQTETA